MTTPDLDKIATPRTDEAEKAIDQWLSQHDGRSIDDLLNDPNCPPSGTRFARQLERELTALRAAVEQKEREVEALRTAKETIKGSAIALRLQVSTEQQLVTSLQAENAELRKVIQTKLDHPSWEFSVTCGALAALQTGGQKGNEEGQPPTGSRQCPRCGGKGWFHIIAHNGVFAVDCRECKGAGGGNTKLTDGADKNV